MAEARHPPLEGGPRHRPVRPGPLEEGVEGRQLVPPALAADRLAHGPGEEGDHRGGNEEQDQPGQPDHPGVLLAGGAAEAARLGHRAAREQHVEEAGARHQQEDLDAAPDSDLPFVVALQEREGEQAGEQEDPDEPSQRQEGDPPDGPDEVLLLRIVEPAVETRQPVAGEEHLDAVEAPGRQRVPAVPVADGQIGAPGERDAPDLRRLVAREVDPLPRQEGVGPLPRILRGERRALGLGIEAQEELAHLAGRRDLGRVRGLVQRRPGRIDRHAPGRRERQGGILQARHPPAVRRPLEPALHEGIGAEPRHDVGALHRLAEIAEALQGDVHRLGPRDRPGPGKERKRPREGPGQQDQPGDAGEQPEGDGAWIPHDSWYGDGLL